MARRVMGGQEPPGQPTAGKEWGGDRADAEQRYEREERAAIQQEGQPQPGTRRVVAGGPPADAGVQAAAAKCSTCGARQTETALGAFWPCGHDQAAAVAAVPPSHVEAARPVAQPWAGTATQVPTLPAPVRHVAPQPGPVPADRAPAPAPTGGPAETVSAAWGLEKYSPQSFFFFDVGPFSATTTLRPGETHAQGQARLYAELSAFAEAERQRKYDSFMKFAQANRMQK